MQAGYQISSPLSQEIFSPEFAKGNFIKNKKISEIPTEFYDENSYSSIKTPTPQLTMLNKIEEEVASFMKDKKMTKKKDIVINDEKSNINSNKNKPSRKSSSKHSEGQDRDAMSDIQNNKRSSKRRGDSYKNQRSNRRSSDGSNKNTNDFDFQKHLVYKKSASGQNTGERSEQCPFEFALGIDLIPNKMLPDCIPPYKLIDPNAIKRKKRHMRQISQAKTQEDDYSMRNRYYDSDVTNTIDYDGIIIEKSGYYYIGEVNARNEKHGKGIYHWPDGMNFYQGDYFRNKMCGFGKFFF